MFETPSDVLANANHLGVKLEVPKDEDGIIASPKVRVTEDLAQGIRQHKDALIREILVRDAFAYLNARYVRQADTSVLDEPGQRIDKYYPVDQPLELYRQAIRDYVTAGVTEFQRARRERV